MKTEEVLMSIGRQEKLFDALYRNAGAIFGLPDCTMWVLYYLSFSTDVLSQQDLIEKMMFPKQTINSAVSGLAKKGLVELTMIPGTRNRKRIILTETGTELADQTVKRMFQAECRAVDQMGADHMSKYMELYREFYCCLQKEFRKEDLIGETYE